MSIRAPLTILESIRGFVVVYRRRFNMCSQTETASPVPFTKFHSIGELRLWLLISIPVLTDHLECLSSRSTYPSTNYAHKQQ